MGSILPYIKQPTRVKWTLLSSPFAIPWNSHLAPEKWGQRETSLSFRVSAYFHQVIPAVTFWSPPIGGHQLPSSSGHVNSPSQKGHKLAELPGKEDLSRKMSANSRIGFAPIFLHFWGSWCWPWLRTTNDSWQKLAKAHSKCCTCTRSSSASRFNFSFSWCSAFRRSSSSRPYGMLPL